jgi:hypothetical protein
MDEKNRVRSFGPDPVLTLELRTEQGLQQVHFLADGDGV